MKIENLMHPKAKISLASFVQILPIICSGTIYFGQLLVSQTTLFLHKKSVRKPI